MKVSTNAIYVYNAAGYDVFDSRTNLQNGEKVRVVQLPGCPKPNTMGHAHVERLNGDFVGIVYCSSLSRPE